MSAPAGARAARPGGSCSPRGTFVFVGLHFGALGDRHGRARVLTLCVLLYSAFTGLGAFSSSFPLPETRNQPLPE